MTCPRTLCLIHSLDTSWEMLNALGVVKNECDRVEIEYFVTELF
jgi:hypothetical protein